MLEHPLFGACGAGRVYCHDADEPFATDASKFALFCHGVCCSLVTNAFGEFDVLHLHDWHAALVLLLRENFSPYQALQQFPAVYTVHNLQLQGVRPFAGNLSSPAHWFWGMRYARAPVVDPRYPDCINLMRTGINLADKVHVVSPTYAQEILQPSNPQLGLIRGEGLEADLRRIDKENKLFGILNGCDYHNFKASDKKPDKKQFIAVATAALEQWVRGRDQIDVTHFHALQRLMSWAQRKQKDQIVVGSVGRLTSQKVSLLQVETSLGVFAIDGLMQRLQDKGYLIVVGSGDPVCEKFLRDAMLRHDNLLFLCGYSEDLGDLVYRFCDLFLMPSTFEPCGISQMLAMRAGTPPLVHKVGGLADTVQHMANGFTFDGANSHEQVQNMLEVFEDVIQLKNDKVPVWQAICRNAAAAHFSWDLTVQEYEKNLYN